MIRASTLASCILLTGLLILGCGGDDETDPTEVQGGPPPAEMVGSWTFQSVTVDGAPDSLADVLEWVAGAAGARLHIESNGAYVYEEVDAIGGQLRAEWGFVFVDGDQIDINTQYDDEGTVDEMSTLTFTLDGGVLTLRDTDQGAAIVFTLTM